MVPELSVFLGMWLACSPTASPASNHNPVILMYFVRTRTDVDDLKEGKGGKYVDQSELILIFLSDGYFESENCMRELLRTLFSQKPLLVMSEPEHKHGGMTAAQVKIALEQANGRFASPWGLEEEMSTWGYDPPPTATAMYNTLYAEEPIEWNRIGIFQDVTLRLIASRILEVSPTEVYVQGELRHLKRKPLSRPSASFHVYCSALNPGAQELITELCQERGVDLLLDDTCGSSYGGQILLTAEASNLPICDHMLLYLTGQTWTRGKTSAALGEEISRAMSLNVHVLLCHEMPGVGGQEARHGCEFAKFFACGSGSTPIELLQRGIYNEIALPLKGGAWREASMALLHDAFAREDKSADGRAVGSASSGHAGRLSKSLVRATKMTTLNARARSMPTPTTPRLMFGRVSIELNSSRRHSRSSALGQQSVSSSTASRNERVSSTMIRAAAVTPEASLAIESAASPQQRQKKIRHESETSGPLIQTKVLASSCQADVAIEVHPNDDGGEPIIPGFGSRWF